MKKKTIWIAAGAAALVIGGAGIAVAATAPFDQDNDRLTGSTLEKASDAALTEVGEGTVSEAERSDDLDHAYSVEVRLDDGTDVDVDLDERFDVVRVDAAAGESDDASRGAGDRATDGAAPAISAEDRSSAESAALAEAGSGTVTELDRSDDADHAWEVEVTTDDGRDVDIELDSDFIVVRVD